MTVITIAHRLSTIKTADVIYILKNGRIVESGSHERLMEIQGEYYQLYLGQETGSDDGRIESIISASSTASR
jgi:ABC-type multidrug transport system fused ATPase/permease subunit